MSNLVAVREAVQALPEEEFDAFSSWFQHYEDERWSHQIERDQKSEPLRSLMEKARADFEAGKCKPL